MKTTWKSDLVLQWNECCALRSIYLYILGKLNDYNRTAVSAGDHIVECDFFFSFSRMDWCAKWLHHLRYTVLVHKLCVTPILTRGRENVWNYAMSIHARYAAYHVRRSFVRSFYLFGNLYLFIFVPCCIASLHYWFDLLFCDTHRGGQQFHFLFRFIVAVFLSLSHSVCHVAFLCHCNHWPDAWWKTNRRYILQMLCI